MRRVIYPFPGTQDGRRFAHTGELPLELIRMQAKGCRVELGTNEPGFTLASNIAELGDYIIELDLLRCSLYGACDVVRDQAYPQNFLES